MSGSARITDATLDGSSVAAVRSQYAGIYNISSDAPAVLNGCAVKDEATALLSDGDELLFAKPAGTKGTTLSIAVL